MPDSRKITDLEIVVCWNEMFKPFILNLYQLAGLECPDKFDPTNEAVRIVAALQTQGFNARFDGGKKP